MAESSSRFIIIIALIILAADGALSAEMRRVKAITVRGLVNLSKYDIMSGVAYRTEGGGISVDLESLRSALVRHRFLESYTVEEADGRLVVSVKEKRPAIIVLVPSENRVSTYVFDASNNLISRDPAHAPSVPIIHVGTSDDTHESLDRRVMRILNLMAVARRRFPTLYREMEDIRWLEDEVRIRLRGRPTLFIVRGFPADFARLRYCAGLCDRTRRYPDRMRIAGNTVTVR